MYVIRSTKREQDSSREQGSNGEQKVLYMLNS